MSGPSAGQVLADTVPTLAEYHDDLARHDWFYEYSDDPAVYRAGNRQHIQLLQMSRRSPEHQALFTAWVEHKKRGADRPARPLERQAA